LKIETTKGSLHRLQAALSLQVRGSFKGKRQAFAPSLNSEKGLTSKRTGHSALLFGMGGKELEKGLR